MHVRMKSENIMMHLAVELVELFLIPAIQVVANALKNRSSGEVGATEILQIWLLGDQQLPTEARKLEGQWSLRKPNASV